MRSSTPTTTTRRRAAATVVLATAFALILSPPPDAFATAPMVPSARPASGGWQWPLTGPVQVSAPYDQPDGEYAAGHRGIDLFSDADSTAVLAPAGGTIAWVGTVADRPLLTIDHGNGYVTTLEPVVATVSIGTTVAAGEKVGESAVGGHSAPGTVHWGVRLNGGYVSPAALFSRQTRPILLPCCDDTSP